MKLTLLVGPVDPTQANTDSLGTFVKVYADAVSTKPGDSGFSTRSLPTPAGGESVLELDALSLQGRAGMTSSGLTPSSSDGKCLPYYEADTAGLGFSSTLHDMASDTVDTFGGTSDLPYQVSPGAPVRINQPKDDQLIPAACADTPVFGPFDPKLAAGQGAYGFLYGTDLVHAKILLVPVG